MVRKCLNLKAKKNMLKWRMANKGILQNRNISKRWNLGMGSQICFSGIHNIWRWRWVRGNKEKACYSNKQAVEVEILLEWSGSSSKTKNSQNMCFPLSYIPYMAVRRGHLEKQLYKELMLLKWSATEKFLKYYGWRTEQTRVLFKRH